MERNVATSQAVILVRELEGKDSHGIAVELRDEARATKLTACALADQADMLAKDDDYRADIANLCAGSAARTDGSQARLDVVLADDAERMREITLWTTTNAKSSDTVAFVAKMAGSPPRQRGTILRTEAAGLGLTDCLMATTLASPPPSLTPHPARAGRARASWC